MYFIYHGYVSADNYDPSERSTYKLTVKETEAEVIAHHKEFLEDLHDECCNEIYRIIKGDELLLKPVQIVTDYKLSDS